MVRKMIIVNIKNMRGVGMIEIMITLLIIAIGLLGLAAMQNQAMRSTTDTLRRTAGLQMATELIERMHMNSGQALTYQNVFAVLNAGCPANPPVQCSAATIGRVSVAGAQCNANQMAAYDAWEVMCDHGNVIDGRGKGAANDYIDQPQMTMVCNPVNCPVGSTVTMTLSWQGRPDARKTIVVPDRVVVTSSL